MRLFGFGKTATATSEETPPASRKLSLEDVSERDMISLYALATVRTYRTGEAVLQDAQNFLVVADGSIQLTVRCGDHSGQAIYVKGDCTNPLETAPDVTYLAEACEASTIIEVTPKVFLFLPDKVQLWMYRNANRSTGRRLQESIRDSLKNQRRSALLSLYAENEMARTRAVVFSNFVQNFIAGIPRLPVFAVNLTTRLLDERTSLNEVVESIEQDTIARSSAVENRQFGVVRPSSQDRKFLSRNRASRIRHHSPVCPARFPAERDAGNAGHAASSHALVCHLRSVLRNRHGLRHNTPRRARPRSACCTMSEAASF